MRSTTIIITCLLACALPFVMHSCKKTNADGGISSCEFFVSSPAGCYQEGDGITFSTIYTAPPNTKFLWDFGDGSPMSKDAGPVHIYKSAGTYTVSLTVNGKTAQVTANTINVLAVKGSRYLAQMGGMRNWKATGDGTLREFGFTYIGDGGDTVLYTARAVTVVDSTRIKDPFYGILFLLTDIDTVKENVLKFSACRDDISLSYYYMQDSIVYYDIWSRGHHWERLIVHTYQ